MVINCETKSLIGSSMPCLLCGKRAVIKLNAKGKPYLDCKVCNTQLFTHTKTGLTRLTELIEGWKRAKQAELQPEMPLNKPQTPKNGSAKDRWTMQELAEKLGYSGHGMISLLKRNRVPLFPERIRGKSGFHYEARTEDIEKYAPELYKALFSLS